MTTRPILTAPDPRLQAVSSDVEAVTDEIRKLAGDVPDGERKRLLQRIARDYDEIAEIAEQRRARNRRSMPSGVAA